MDSPTIYSPAWFNALTLTERLLSLRNNQSVPIHFGINAEFGKQRLQSWKSQSPFNTDSYFSWRLEMDDISEDELITLLGEPVEALQGRFLESPIWLKEIVQAFASPTLIKYSTIEHSSSDAGMLGFVGVIGPLLSQAKLRIQEVVKVLVQSQSFVPFDPTTIENILFANLPEKLLIRLGRTMVRELNIARLEGLLEGRTSEERFNNFLHRIRQKDVALALLAEYPVLARQLIILINNWINYCMEFLSHLCSDREVIRAVFNSERDLGVLVSLKGSAGDTHRCGRSVMIAKFSSGLQVIYKPHSLTIDMHFQELLNWFNLHDSSLPFRILKILDRWTYGWVEFATPHDCNSSDEVWRFYERQGRYLALLYALEAVDIHCENLIAAGEHPVLVDLEALFHPHLKVDIPKKTEEMISRMMEYSVLRVGLLPLRLWANLDYEGLDISGLGAEKGQLIPDRLPQPEGMNTDEMRFVRKPLEMPGSNNRPKLEGKEVNLLDYSPAIITGFTSFYRRLMELRDELTSPTGPLIRFSEDVVRVVVRPTRSYMLLLFESYHPDMLRNALDRDRFFDRLWVGVKDRPILKDLIPSEREDLLRGDIPIFTTQPISRDLWSSSGDRIVGFIDEPSMMSVNHRLQQLNEQDLVKQTWFIRASLTALAVSVDRLQKPMYHPIELERVPPFDELNGQLLKGALSVGNRLEALSLRTENDIAWLSLSQINEKYWTITALEFDLYGGYAGVALFLAYLGAITQDERFTSLARQTISILRHKMESLKIYLKTIGFFTGWGGYIYALTHLGILWNEPALLEEAEAVVKILPDLISVDEKFDIIAGSAGCIGALVSLYHCSPSDRTLAAMMQCGDRLITCATPIGPSLGWIIPGFGSKPLTGFAHGASGIAWALLGLANLTGEDRFRSAGFAALDYERNLYSSREHNWPDVREMDSTGKIGSTDQIYFPIAWCYGAPGIGLSRLSLLRDYDCPQIRSEIKNAVDTTLKRGFGKNHSLCHGDLGNLEFLLKASITLNNSRLNYKVNRLTAIILDSIEKDGWICGVPLGTETPDLMCGLAGIGYELLRLAEPTRVPSVLILEPPILKT